MSYNLVPIFGMISVFFVPAVTIILIIWLKSVEKKNRQQLQAELYMKAIEKGQPIPADLFAELQLKKKRNPLNTGIICIATGIGIALFIWLSRGAIPIGVQIGKAASIGIIPFLIGVAYVIIHFIEKGKAANEDAQ